MKEFTNNEKIVAKNINKEYKWMARDKSGILCAFIHKPYKTTLSIDGTLKARSAKWLRSTGCLNLSHGVTKIRH